MDNGAHKQILISNLKRSLSRSSSISSLKSLLKAPFGENSARNHSIVTENPKKRKKFNFFRHKNESLEQFGSKSGANGEQLGPANDFSGNNEFSPADEDLIKRRRSSRYSSTKKQNARSNTNRTFQRRNYTPIQPLVPVDNQNFQNLNALDEKDLGFNSRNGRVFSTIDEETSEMIPQSKTTFNFKVRDDVNSHTDEVKLNPHNGIVASKGFYNLVKFTEESDEENTLVNIKTTPQSARDITMDSLTPKPEEPLKDEKYINNNGLRSGFLDYFNNNIEQFHTRNFADQPHLFKSQFGTLSSNYSVAHLTSKLSMARLSDNEPHKPNIIFEIPEIVENILMFVEAGIVLPIEKPPNRRKPLSFEHAKLIYENDEIANKIWQETENRDTEKLNQLILASYLKFDGLDVNHHKKFNSKFYSNAMNQSIKNFKNVKSINKTIYNCLFVNKLWNSIAKKLIFNKMFFNKDENFQKLIRQLKYDDNKEVKENLKTSKTSILLLHKVKHVTQDQINLLANYLISNGNNLEWIEMYICPSIYPPLSLFTSYLKTSKSTLKKLILAGSNSKKINNFFLKVVATNCPNIEKIDLRSCEYFTDDGLIEIAANCNKLSYINVGRFKNCDTLTDLSICALVRNCDKLQTLGCAGCSVTDMLIYSLAEHQNISIEKLSLNNCVKLTNQSFNEVLRNGFLQNLQVLEIRNILNIEDFSELIKFKLKKINSGSHFLIENCQVLEKRMKQKEFEISLQSSKQLLKDLQEWCMTDDSDITVEEFFALKSEEHAITGIS